MQTNQLNSAEAIKQQVRDQYSKLTQPGEKATFCGLIAEKYDELTEVCVDLGLGCGRPTDFIQIKEGDVVLDLGSGTGNDCFIARKSCGESGKVIGVDMTPEMITVAQLNSDKQGFRNVEFRNGEIENLPILDNFVDVVISNCVICLVPDKVKAFSEIYRVLKQGGRLSFSDVLVNGQLPENIRRASELYAGCVAGAKPKEWQLDMIQKAGFVDVQIRKEKIIRIPDEELLKLATPEELKAYRDSGVNLLSVTIVAQKQ